MAVTSCLLVELSGWPAELTAGQSAERLKVTADEFGSRFFAALFNGSGEIKPAPARHDDQGHAGSG
jgi:hypothetical protein